MRSVMLGSRAIAHARSFGSGGGMGRPQRGHLGDSLPVPANLPSEHVGHVGEALRR